MAAEASNPGVLRFRDNATAVRESWAGCAPPRSPLRRRFLFFAHDKVSVRKLQLLERAHQSDFRHHLVADVVRRSTESPRQELNQGFFIDLFV